MDEQQTFSFLNFYMNYEPLLTTKIHVIKRNVKKMFCSVLNLHFSCTQLTFIKSEATGYVPASSFTHRLLTDCHVSVRIRWFWAVLKKCSYMHGHICCVLDQSFAFFGEEQRVIFISRAVRVLESLMVLVRFKSFPAKTNHVVFGLKVQETILVRDDQPTD